MVARHFLLRHGDEQSSLDYDTDDGLEVLKFQIFSLTSVPPDEQKILIEDGNIVLTEASDLESISDKLRLVSLQDSEEGTPLGEAKGEAKPAAAASDLENSGISDEELARILQAEEEALYAQQLRAGDGKREFEKRIRPHVSQVRMYEDYHRQQEARKTVPVDELEEKALLSLAKEGIFSPSEEETDHAFLLQLLFWFKQSFRWVNAPACDSCGSETSGFGMGAPLPAERQFDASRVELYRCNRCLKITRFPRYNDPLKLLETRRGRCGEWANCFTLYCRAFGYESRMILDFTDHVWTECFSQFLGRWTHLDPCEGIHDNPLLYEKGWNKKLSYVIAISKDGVHDVTKRYTKKWHEVLSRRNITTESSVLAVLSDITTECRRSYSSEAISVLESRDKKESEELETLHLQSSSSLSLPGRQSGSKEWRMARSELGSQISDSLSSSSCPVRTCIDNHVRNIYCSFTHLLSDFIGDGLPKSVVVRYLGILKRLLLHLKSTSFKVRKTFINLSSSGSQLYKREGSSLYEFLAAISLKREELDHKLCISLAGNPVQTSLALPVALDLLDEAIDCLECVTHFDQNFLVNFSRLNRISCGSVLASGEELPFGISTSAFDGARLTKWEEPNGAKGCWLVYKIADGLMHELEAYELMSANDVPERDPMDWIVEGSEDGGANWHTLDQQTS